jgi:hypothetical protein
VLVRKQVRFLLIGTAIVLGVDVAGCGSFDSSMCGNQVVMTIPSPDARHTAVVFERNCGATTDFSTQVALDPSDISRPSGVGNLWIADANHDAAPRALWGGPDVQIEWTSPTAMRLLHHRGARVFKAERSLHGVAITYDFLSDTAP